MLLSLGCIISADLGPSDTDGATGSTSSQPTDTSASTTGPDPSTTDPTADSGTSGEPTGDSSGDPPVFDCPPAPFEEQCDVVAQDCPAGFHCIPWSSEGEANPHATVCSPLAETPVDRYASCTIDAETCSDDCGVGEYCLLTDASDSGLCVGACDWDGDDATCMEGELCDTCAKCSVGTCWAGCDPLAPACPDGAPTCVLSGEDGAFECLPVPDGGIGLEMQCATVFDCGPGLICAPEDYVNGCDGLGSCCTELCDLEDGEPGCSNPGHACIPIFFPDPGLPGQQHVGYCGLPELDPCLVPGNCPPDGIDDSVPWCSLANEGFCPVGALAGFFNGVACEQTCTCELPCMGPGDCPVPATGTATGECVVEPYGPGSPTSCLYACDAGQTCPDGMTCSDELGFGEICVWVSPADPVECM